MDRHQILTALVGMEGAAALQKAAQRLPHLDNAMLPRALYAWLSLAGRGYDGEIPGGGGRLVLQKTEAGFSGCMSVADINYTFQDASLLHVAAALGVGLGLERQRVSVAVSDDHLYRLGKSVDALVRARVAHAVLRKSAAEKTLSFEKEYDVQEEPPRTIIRALDGNNHQAGVLTLTGVRPDDLRLHSWQIDTKYSTLEKKMVDVLLGLMNKTSALKKNESSLPPHTLMSAENPLFPQAKNLSNQQALQYLRDAGEDAHPTVGSYGRPENSLIIYNPKNPKLIEGLARDLGQESVIHSDGASHKMLMVNGENVGKYHPGQGTQWHNQKPEDYYTILPDGRVFTHYFDFNQLHSDLEKAGKGRTEAPGPANKPTPQGGPLAPNPPTRQQSQPPKLRPRQPKLDSTAIKLPSLRLSEKQLSTACGVCDGQRLSADGRFEACHCFRDLASDVRLEKTDSSYLLSFGGKWKENAILAFLDNVYGVRSHD
jgi:hypothetical protein